MKSLSGSQTNNLSSLQSSFFAALSAILYGFLGFLGTGLLPQMTVANMLFWRFFIGALWMLPFLLRRWPQLKETLTQNSPAYAKVFLLGSVAYTGSSAFYFISSTSIGTGLAMVIFFSYPVFIALAAWIFKKNKMNFAVLSTLATMMLGLFLLRQTNNSHFNLVGICAALIAALAYAFYVASSKKYAMSLDAYFLTFIVCLSCTVVFLLICLYQGKFVVPHTASMMLYALGLGIIATALPIQLMLEGLKNISSLRASIISVLEPLITLAVGVAYLAESLTRLQIIGAALILGSALLIQLKKDF